MLVHFVHFDRFGSPKGTNWPQWCNVIVSVVTDSILTKIGGFFRMGGEPKVCLLSDGR